ncbi:MAG: class I SAM-dependent RNA methyltransferase, partial [Lachnospiraceae bacterium]|nr:class I SAM-dependent RNA methyltransferase [Lachnospiraceae bacterium]
MKENLKKPALRKQPEKKQPEKMKPEKKKPEIKKPEIKKPEIKVLEKAPATNCPVERKCGGCSLLYMPYAKQLARKQEMVEDLISDFCKVEPILGMKDPFHYRNKVNAAFAYTKDRKIVSGIYQEGTHRVVPVDSCLIEDETADAVIRTIRGLLPSFRIKTYDEDSGYGLLRHVQVRVGKKSGQIMVVLVLASPILPSKNNFVKALLKAHPQITTVILNVNDKKTTMVLGERNITLYGPGYIEDQLG